MSAAVVAEVRQWDKQVTEWARACNALEESGAWMREAPKPVRRRAAPAIKAWKLPTQRRWMLLHDGQEVVGPVRQWVRETLQNSYSLQYLTSQSAGLYTRGAEPAVRVGDVLHIDGEGYTVRQLMGGQVMCSVGEEDGADDWETLSMADAEAMMREKRGEATHAPSPDVRLVRDMWARRGGRARVHAVKFMWGLFACGDLLHRRCDRRWSGSV